jgi:hypothetical protein
MKWILIRNGEVTNIFESREYAIKHYKTMLKQTLKDLKNQDKKGATGYDYSIKKPEIEIKPIKEREAYLGL